MRNVDDYVICHLSPVGGGGEAVESGTGESTGEAPAVAPQPDEQEQEGEEEEEQRAEPREGEGEWQQVSIPAIPPGVLEVSRVQ